MHLRLLSAHHDFSFPARDQLMYLYDSKTARFDPRMIYSGLKSSYVHSLEAFVGLIDFAAAKGQIHNGSMMASPAASAAYFCSWYSGQNKTVLTAYVSRVTRNVQPCVTSMISAALVAADLALPYCTFLAQHIGYSAQDHFVNRSLLSKQLVRLSNRENCKPQPPCCTARSCVSS
jgi:hypothetical protein